MDRHHSVHWGQGGGTDVENLVHRWYNPFARAGEIKHAWPV
jgi:hypothetical protein